MRRIGSKGDTVPAQKHHHGVECGTFVAVDKSVVTRKTECIGRGKRGQLPSPELDGETIRIILRRLR